MPPRKPTRSTRAAAGAFIFSPATGSTAGTAGNSLPGSESAARCWSFAVCSPGRTRLFASAPETRRSCAPRAISSRSTPTRVLSRGAPESSSARRSTAQPAPAGRSQTRDRFSAATACCIPQHRRVARERVPERLHAPLCTRARRRSLRLGRRGGVYGRLPKRRLRGEGAPSMWGRISRVWGNAFPKGAY